MDHAELVAAMGAALDNQNLDALADLVTDDFQFDNGVMPPTGKDAWLGQLSAMFTAMPDLNFNLTYVESDGDVATVYSELTGTHTGPLDLSMMGGPTVPATGTYIESNREYSEGQIVGDKISYIQLFPEEGSGFGGVLAALGIDRGG